MINILVIGSGARECMIIKKLLNDSSKLGIQIEIDCFGTNNNPYIAENCNMHVIDNFDIETFEPIFNNIIVPNFAIIGPEKQLEYGYADFFEINEIPCIGPLTIYSKIESSKIFTREFIKDIGLGKFSPYYKIVEGINIVELSKDFAQKHICSILNNFDKINVVYKKDGLYGGKGVKVQGVDFMDKSELCEDLINLKDGENVILEEKLIGEEFSLMTITDGKGNCGHFPPIQDYKRLNDNDYGPNTGGMGCVIGKDNKLNFLTDIDILLAQNINKRVIDCLNDMGDDEGYTLGYRGILYGSYIKTNDGKIYIIEFNSRFGDPECIIGLSLLRTNFFNLCCELVNQNLMSELLFHKNAMICVYLVPNGYPTKSESNFDIYIKEDLIDNIVFGNVKKDGKHLYSQSSRSLIYFEKGETVAECYKILYKNITGISGNLHYRKDIGTKFITSYEEAGVSIDNGNEVVKSIKPYIEKTYNENVMGKHGDFGGQFKFGNEILVASIDGVGTKSVLAVRELGDEAFINLGKDIINHSVNDILVQGAYPLFFLDYFGAANIKINEVVNFIKGASYACIENGNFPILGGETAEMPSIYNDNRTDLVGCIVGYKDSNFFKDTVINSGDILIGLLSSGPHTNGYSLINKIVENTEIDKKVISNLLNPHKSYLNDVNSLINKYGYDSIKGMCHITGGGMIDNLKRVVPSNFGIKLEKLELPEWCEIIMNKGNISRKEMERVFNCGIGFVIIISKETYSKLKHDTNFVKSLYVGYLE